MGMASFSEDILKRHESDVQELLRALELRQLSEAEQKHVLPQFEEVVRKLGEMLADPAQPAVMRLLELRNREVNLAAEVRRLESANNVLGLKNGEVNEREKRALKERDLARAEIRALKQRCESFEKDIEAAKRAHERANAQHRLELDTLRDELAEKTKEAKSLEIFAMEGQIDRRL